VEECEEADSEARALGSWWCFTTYVGGAVFLATRMRRLCDCLLWETRMFDTEKFPPGEDK